MARQSLLVKWVLPRPAVLALCARCRMGRKADLKLVDRLCREAGLMPGSRQALRFRNYLHKCKETGSCELQTDGNLGEDGIRELIQEFLDHEGGRR